MVVKNLHCSSRATFLVEVGSEVEGGKANEAGTKSRE